MKNLKYKKYLNKRFEQKLS